MVMFEAIDDIWNDVRNFNEYSRALVTLATSIGALVLIIYTLKMVYKSFIGFNLYCLNQSGCWRRQDLKKKHGEWAIISGATDGIGLSMAHELARQGMSIIVIGRNEEKLSNTKEALEQELNAGEIITIKIDLSDSSLDNFSKACLQIDPAKRDIGILINNAATIPERFLRFNRYDMEYLRNIINLNILATVYLTRMVMPSMIERGKGLVVNVSSSLGSIPAPYMSLYGATKSFIDAFSRQLQIEYSDHPIRIVNLTPGPIYTKLFKNTSKVPESSFFIPSPDEYAKTSLNALSAGVSEYSGFLTHGMGKEFLSVLDCLGLIPFIFRIQMKLTARNHELSPVPKRKKSAASVVDHNNRDRGDDTQRNPRAAD